MATKKDDSKSKKDEPKAKKPAKAKANRDSDPGPIPEKEPAPAKQTAFSDAFLREALALGRRLDVDRLLYIGGEGTPLEALTARGIKKKVIVASSSDKLAVRAEELGLSHELIPAYAFDRFEKIKVALAGCTSTGLASDGMLVLCMVGEHASGQVDTCMVSRVGKHSDEQASLAGLLADSEQSAQVLESVLNIALSVGFEGIEGDPVGTIFVVGDSTAVMERSKQLTLNPFQGYSEEERNILDPAIRDAVKNFCLLDGAIIVREDGVLLAAGRYLRPPEDLEIDLPLGLGTRNAAAMGISQVTTAVTFVISKSSGSVRIYKEGKLAVELKQPRRRT